MAKSYPYELRIRVMKALEEGMKITKISRVFTINRDTIYKWIKIKKETGNILPRLGNIKNNGRIINYEKIPEFEEFIDKNNDKTLDELAQVYPIKMTSRTICNYIKRIGYSYKKNFYSPKA